MTPRPASVRVLSGGAAKGLMAVLRPAFAECCSAGIEGTFGAVGAMKEKLLAGEACDVAILTAALVDELTASGHLVPGSSAPLGRVRTGIAVRTADALPDIADRASLARAMRSARAIYFPDPQRATAGIHFVSVLRRLGVEGDVAPYLRPFADGATAMQQLAQAREAHAIGCTQLTEILYTQGVALVGSLPLEFELATVYAAAVARNAADPERAIQLVALLSGAVSGTLRAAGGFEA